MASNYVYNMKAILDIIMKYELFQECSMPSKRLNKYRTCAIAVCKNPNNVSYYSFPKEPSLRKIWVKACKRDDPFNPNQARLCQQHFDEKYFERDLLNELLKKPQKMKLKPDAVPTLRLSTSFKSPSKTRQNRLSRRSQRKVANELCSQASPPPSTSFNIDQAEPMLEESFLGENAPTSPNEESMLIPFNGKDLPVAASSNQTEEDQKEIAALKAKNSILQMYLNSERRARKKLQKKVKRLTSKTYKNLLVKKQIEKVLLPAQVKRIIAPTKKYFHYKKKDIVPALVIKSISRRCFDYLRSTKLIEMPVRQTLERWLQNYNCDPGLQKDSIRILEEMCKTLEDENRFSVLCFDEIQVKKKYEIDLRAQKVYGPVKKCQVATLRGLVQPWKQPVFYKFDTNMDKKLLMSLITEMEEKGFQVRATVFDMGNKTLLKELGLNNKNNNVFSFKNPVHPSRSVYVFPDVPHLLKLIRNHLLDKTFLLPDGKGGYDELSKRDFEELLQKDSSELRICHKVHYDHLNCKSNARQRVRPAAQLLSRTVGKAFTYFYGEKGLLKEKALLTIDSWFDTMNSRQIVDKKKLASAFGVEIEDQMKALDDMEQLIKEMKIEGLSHKLPWQKGILISIQSMRALYDDLVVHGPLQFILTTRLNQDHLENYFSRIRGIGGDNSHPSPVILIKRIRILQVGNHADILVPNAPVQLEKEEEVCVTNMITKDIMDIPPPDLVEGFDWPEIE